MTRLSRGLGWSLLALALVRVWLRSQGQAFGPGGDPWIIGLIAGLGLLLLAGHRWIKYALRRLPEADGLTHERLLLIGQFVQLAVILVLYAVMQGSLEIALLGGFPAIVAHWLGYPKLARWINALVVGVLLAWVPFGYPALFVTSGAPTVLLLVPVVALYAHAIRMMGQLNQQARGQVSHLNSLATTDPLTGLVNRRSLNLRLSGELARSRRYQMPLSIALFDLDNFKRVNDQYGHPVGDMLLRELADLMVKNVRESDLLVRYGGEEFALVLPETRQLAAYDLMERLRRMVAKHRFCEGATPLSVTLSIGVTQFDSQRHTALEFVAEADQALYQAKRGGKNQVVLFGVQPLPAPDETPVNEDASIVANPDNPLHEQSA